MIEQMLYYQFGFFAPNTHLEPEPDIVGRFLEGGFLKLYGYTNDSDGIRHAMLEESQLTQADAVYFLVSCSAFVNYLKSKITE